MVVDDQHLLHGRPTLANRAHQPARFDPLPTRVPGATLAGHGHERHSGTRTRRACSLKSAATGRPPAPARDAARRSRVPVGRGRERVRVPRASTRRSPLSPTGPSSRCSPTGRSRAPAAPSHQHVPRALPRRAHHRVHRHVEDTAAAGELGAHAVYDKADRRAGDVLDEFVARLATRTREPLSSGRRALTGGRSRTQRVPVGLCSATAASPRGRVPGGAGGISATGGVRRLMTGRAVGVLCGWRPTSERFMRARVRTASPPACYFAGTPQRG